jgi:hypothetical protein
LRAKAADDIDTRAVEESGSDTCRVGYPKLLKDTTPEVQIRVG